MASASIELLRSAARAGAAGKNLPRPSLVALGKRRQLSCTPRFDARNSRPYATPEETLALQDKPVQPAALPSAPLDQHFVEKPQIGPSNLISKEYLEQLYSILMPPYLQALAALAERLPQAKFTAEHTSLVELCCICPSFWDAVDDAQPLPTDRQGPFTNFWDQTRGTNAELAALGESMLGLFVAEHLEAKYPSLPYRVMRDAVEAYVGDQTCADVARIFGVFAGSASQAREPTADERRNKQGRTAGQGLLRWQRKDEDQQTIEESGKTAAIGAFTQAMASVSRAMVGAVFQEHGWEQTRHFVNANWLSRYLHIESLLRFVRPRNILMETLVKDDKPPAEARLLKEAGRDTHMPVFVVGLFSGRQKLGEGYGSTTTMAEFRAAEDSLRRIYLQRPFTGTHHQRPDYHERLPLPSDTLVEGAPDYKPRPIGDDEVEYGRASQPGPQDGRPPFRPPGYLPTSVSREPKKKQTAAERRPVRPTEGPGSKDPSLPLEHRMPRYQLERSAGGPSGRREKGNDRPVKPVRDDKIVSPYAGPFDQMSILEWSRAEADQIRKDNQYEASPAQ